MYMTERDDSNPPRKRRPRSKEKTSDDAKKVSREQEVEATLKEQINEALNANLTEYVKKKNLSQKQVSILNSFIEEHLSCFILLGYTVEGNTLTVVNAQTQKDSDSLGTLIQKFMMMHVGPNDIPPIV